MSFFDDSSSTQLNIPKWMKPELLAAQDAFSANQISPYGGLLQADLNPRLQGAWDNLYNSDTQNRMMGNMEGIGNFGMTALNQGYDFLRGLQDQGAPQFQYDQGTYDQAFGNLSGGMQNQFDLGARNISRGFDWNMLPGLNMQNALGGGQGSTKFGQAGALGQAMADQNVMQFGSDLWSNAANQANRDAMAAGGANLNSQNSMISTLMNGYQNYGNLAGQGYTNAYNMGNGIGQNMLSAGAGQQDFTQQGLDMSRQQHYYDQDRQTQFLQNQMNQLGNLGGMYGETQSDQDSSTLSKIGQTVGVVGDIYGLGAGMGAWGSPDAGIGTGFSGGGQNGPTMPPFNPSGGYNMPGYGPADINNPDYRMGNYGQYGAQYLNSPALTPLEF